MNKIALFALAIFFSTIAFSQKNATNKLEVTKGKLYSVTLLKDLIVDLPVGEEIISFEVAYKAKGKVVSESKKGDESIKGIATSVDVKSLIYLDIKCKNSSGKIKSYTYTIFVKP